MKTFQERVEELAKILLTTRDFCGNEREAAADYFADEGFPRGISPERDRLLLAACEQANARWNEYRRASRRGADA